MVDKGPRAIILLPGGILTSLVTAYTKHSGDNKTNIYLSAHTGSRNAFDGSSLGPGQKLG